MKLLESFKYELKSFPLTETRVLTKYLMRLNLFNCCNGNYKEKETLNKNLK